LQPLQGGELALNGTAVLMRATIAGVNSGNPIAVLMECAGGAQQVAPATQSQHAVQMGQIFSSITATVGSNALTGTFVGSTALPFRNPTLTNGAPVVGTIATNLSLTVPSGATLGTVSGQAARIVWLVAYNGGAPALCVVNLAGGVNLDETTLISTTAISAGATAANVIYSGSAITNSPFRVVGFCDISEATAGTWATAPTTVQGVGGQALAALSSLGYGQTWQDVTASRLLATTYYNTTGRPIQVKVSAQSSSTNYFAQLSVNGVNIVGSTSPVANVIVTVDAVVPPGASYVATIPVGGASLSKWFELR
jgi:hypothetical protein